jgi:hypothetical protein
MQRTQSVILNKGQSLADPASLLVEAPISSRWMERLLPDALGSAVEQIQRYESHRGDVRSMSMPLGLGKLVPVTVTF